MPAGGAAGRHSRHRETGSQTALQRHARDSRGCVHGVRAHADDGRPGAAGAAALTAHLDDLGDVGADRVPARRVGRDADRRPPRRPVRQGTAARNLAVDLPLRLHRLRARVEHLVADRVSRGRRRRRRRLPALVRDHPRRVPARARRCRHRSRLRRVRRRRRLRHRLRRVDRRQPELAVALHPRRDRHRSVARARAPLRAGVADQDTDRASTSRARSCCRSPWSRCSSH